MYIVTTSWDDGDALDTRLSDTLDRYGIKGTFYIARDYRKPRVSDDAIRKIASRHEIGAHTLTHPNLTLLSREEKTAEVAGSKRWLEAVTGKEVGLFCYPGGKFDDETVEVVREAGFAGARTTRQDLNQPLDAYRFGTSLTFYPHPFTSIDRMCSWYRRAAVPFSGMSWFSGELLQKHELLEQYVDERLAEARVRGIFHLYGHSWANTRFGLWPVLERILKKLSEDTDAVFLTNREALIRLRETLV